ncbi:hypothetical protein [uncultured Murdochiella sp.]|nr:hypothetical protein [uncultured Murdochiella sp.]
MPQQGRIGVVTQDAATGQPKTQKGIDAVMQMSRKADVGQRMHERGAK